MAKVKVLTAAKIEAMGKGKHPHGSVPGLVLVKGATGSASWVWRCMVKGTRHELGLGSYPAVTIDEAAEEAGRLIRVAKAGGDPSAQRKTATAVAPAVMTVREAIDGMFAAKRAKLRGADDGRWLSPLNVHVIPVIGGMSVLELDQKAIVKVLKPIWSAKPDTGLKAWIRLKMAMSYARAHGLKIDLTMFEDAKEVLGEQHVVRVMHPAMPWREVPAFFTRLVGDNSGAMAPRALALLILTAVRVRPVLRATADQFDLERAVWTIPAANMKGKEGKVTDFRVPLSPAAVALVRGLLDGVEPGAPLFVGRSGGFVNDTFISHWMARHGRGYVAHGFRSSFRDWAAETGKDWAAAETSLAHVIGGSVERSYARSDLLEQRRVLMGEWAEFVVG